MDKESGDRKKERDAVFKYFISRKDILIPLLQFAVERLRGPEMKEKLENALEKEEGGNRIRCLNTESSSLSNGRIIYDSLFDVDLPDGDGFMLRVDVEEQLYGTTAYPLEARAAYYLGRMMSDQKNTDFRNDNYGDIRKVMSLWIMLDSPQYLWNTAYATETELVQFCGEPRERDNRRFDFFQMVVINVPPDHCEPAEPVLGIFSTLFSNSMGKEEITEKLKEDFKIVVDDEFTEELGKLIATREGDRNYYYDKGIADDREVFVRYYADRVRSRIASGMTREEAVESLSIPDFILDQVNTELDR